MATITAQLYLQIVGMYYLGQSICLLAVDIPAMKELYKKSNASYSLKRWLQSDWNIALAIQLLGLTLLIGLPEILQWKPTILEKIRWFSWVVGFLGSGIISRMSKYRKAVLAIIDKKTNIADGISDPKIPA